MPGTTASWGATSQPVLQVTSHNLTSKQAAEARGCKLAQTRPGQQGLQVERLFFPEMWLRIEGHENAAAAAAALRRPCPAGAM